MAAMIFFCFFFASLVVTSCSAFVCENYNDCRTLLQFKKEVTSDPDGHLHAWNEANPFCNWTGITCHQHQQNRVVALQLEGMRLQGSLSPFLSNLSLLTELSLHTNSFYGEIPTSFGELSQLGHLNLSLNKLQGNIPVSLRGCQSLKFIDLSNNNLSGVIPEEFGLMKNLTYLALSHNSLNGFIPSILSDLTELTRLELSFNYFTGKIPPELGALKKLEILYLHVNYLDGSIPSAISNCTALREISMIDNSLSGEIPAELGSKLQNLRGVHLSINELSGKIPVTFSNLSQLILLDLSINKLKGEVPLELGKLKNLENLYLHSNDLVSGSDNSSLNFLTALTNCSRLKKLNMRSCFFAGKLPDSVGDLSKELYYFNLRSNLITGNVPEAIGNLSSLVTLELGGNLLEGNLPTTFGKLGQLQRLNLGQNRLSGEIPGEIGKMANLGSLNLSDNLISGSIPTSLCNTPPLRYLYLSHNRLSANIPIELTLCSLLKVLDLSYNDLQGPVPSQIGLLSNLALSLNLSNNNFDGHIPETIGNLVQLEAIDLSHNNFSGVIPSSIGGCISLEYLNFSSNMLQGPLPESLQVIEYLISLDLSHNQLNGTVPAWIGDKKMIKTLNLSFNRLSGEVPKSGRFGSFSASSFVGNADLSGGYSELDLHPCEVQKQKNKINKKALFVVLAVIPSCVVFLSAALFVHRFFSKKSGNKEESLMLRAFSGIHECSSTHWTRSYTQRELEIATSRFNEANLLGRGSFGSVYKAVIDNGRTIVAVKVFDEFSGHSYKSLQRECEILSEIKHRNLLRIMGSSWNSGFKALVFEFMPNGNLEQHLYPGGLEEGPCKLTLEERMSIAIDVANGLEYLQEGCPTQVVHCDLKPQNVLLNYDMVAHIADFSIGKLLLDRPNEQSVTTGFLRGTVGYIPPEYGQGIKVSAKGDIYSYGVMLLEMITRKRPTSSMFSDGLHLRKWVISLLPNNILDVVDTTLKQQARLGGGMERLEKCCIQVLNVALMCTRDKSQDRPLMSSVVRMLSNISKELKFEAPNGKQQKGSLRE